MEEMDGIELPRDAYFVDFIREAPEPTGDEPEDAEFDAPKIYEQVIQCSVRGSCLTHLSLFPDSFI